MDAVVGGGVGLGAGLGNVASTRASTLRDPQVVRVHRAKIIRRLPTERTLMLDGYDPLVVLMLRGAWYLFLLALACGILYVVIRYAVRDGIRLARADAQAAKRE
ncbi:hypothetical protein AB0F81_24445 [Actinoplanes sp. NPDC024001]|uniref:hypothetical protein n=1 Tax=Actinoplanes sp. NPDC024001 TaxID=3154598 RepID=UPI00340F5730